jgi:predicted phosphodiesterase
MAIPSHFSSILLSNWQSAVAKMLVPATPVKDATRAPHDIQAPEIVAAAAAAQSYQQANEDGGAVALTVPLHQDAQTALNYAIALIDRDIAMAAAKTQEAVASAEALLEEADFGDLSPFWLECVAEFYEHYKLAENASPPYTKYATLNDFVLSIILKDNCRIAIIGDWGTGEPRAQALLEEIAAKKPDLLIHLGDIYYSCTSAEANRFYENCQKALGFETRVFTLCGNHDMYSGAAPYYALLKRIGQPASFFCLRNAKWQIVVGDTGFNDFNPLTQGADATWIRDRDEGDTYSELDWHRDKFVHASGRKTILLTHHQLFSRNSAIHHDVSLYKHKQELDGIRPVNQYLLEQFAEFLPQVAVWIWGHEHNQVIYKPFVGLQRGRCVGASAIPVPVTDSLYSIDGALTGQEVPELIDGDPKLTQLRADTEGKFYQLGYAMLTLDADKASVEYLQFDPVTKSSSRMFEEDL